VRVRLALHGCHQAEGGTDRAMKKILCLLIGHDWTISRHNDWHNEWHCRRCNESVILHALLDIRGY
jgi:hypothetical protein